jgi:hypothetical protein
MAYNVETQANLAAKKSSDALARIASMETFLNQVAQDFQKVQDTFGQVNNNFQSLAKQMEAVSLLAEAMAEILGQEQVVSKIKEIQERRQVQALKNAEDLAVQQTEAVKVALGDGKISATETITEASLIVVKETDKNGNVLHPGRAQAWVNTLATEFKSKLLGLKVGEKMEGANGSSVEILEIYEMVAETPSQPASEAVVDVTPTVNETPATV